MNQADFWLMPSSRCSFMDENPLMFVVNRYKPTAHAR